ncbi:MAG TPA: hypothetical protein VGK19_05925 [Capsulimonadaceae bacterium]|jgi:hypothetical protein
MRTNELKSRTLTSAPTSPGQYWRNLATAGVRDRVFTSTVLIVAFTALYMVTQARYYTFDAVSYAHSIYRYDSVGDLYALFHPHHLLFNLTGWILWKLAHVFGYIGGPLEVLKTMNAVLGAVGIAILSLALRSVLTRSRALAVLFPIGLGVSFGYWVCATDGRVNMPSNVLLIASFYALVLTMQSPSKRRALMTGLLSALSLLYHESAGLFVIVAFIGIWLGEYPQGTAVEEHRTRRTLLGVFFLTWLLVTVIPYAVVGLGVLHLTSPEGFKDWAARYAVLGWWWDFHIIHNLRLDIYAIRKCLFTEPTGKQGTFHIAHGESDMGFVIYMTALGIWLFAVYLATIALPLLLRTHYRPYLIVTIIWGAVNTAFFTIWQPEYFVFRVPTIISSALLLAMVASHYRAKRSGQVWLLGIGVWVALIGISNYIQNIGPHENPKSNPYLALANDIKHRTGPQDIFVLAGTGYLEPDEVYIPYFAKRAVFSIHTEMSHNHENYAAMKSSLIDTMNATRAAGGSVYVLNDIYDQGIALAALSKQHGLSQAMLNDLFVGQVRSKAWKTKSGQPVWKMSPLPVKLPQLPRE